MAAGKVKKEKKQILNLVGKGGEYANDTDKKALKDFLDAGGDHNFFIIEQGNTNVFKWPNLGAKGNPKTVYIFAETKAVENIKSAYRSVDKGDSTSFKGLVGSHPVNLTATKKTDGLQAATITKMQELASLEIFKAGIERNKIYKSVNDIRKDTYTMKLINKIWKDIGGLDTVDDDWLENFYKQQQALLGSNGIGNRNVTEFNREKGFMKFISDVGNQKFGVGGKDNWDPADIWLIRDEQKARDEIKKIVNKPSPNFEQFQSLMRQLFNAHKNAKDPMVFGISLKKVGKGEPAQIEFVNHELAFFKRLEDIQLKYVMSKCNLGTKTDKGGSIVMGSQDTRFIIQDGGSSTYDFQIKGNNSTDFSNLKYEPTAKGATAARLGKATVELVITTMRENFGLSYTKDNSSYPMDVDQLERQKDDIIRKISTIQRKGCDTVEKDPVQCYENLKFSMLDAPWTANSKIQQITWLSLILSLSKKKLDSFSTEMLFMAKKEGTRYGPFAKIF